MKVIFFLPAGMIEWGVPPDAREAFNFHAMVSRIRADGYFMAPDLYIQHVSIVGIQFVQEGVAPTTTVAGMTKQ